MKLWRKIKNVIKVVLERSQPKIIVQPTLVDLAPNELLKGHAVLVTGGTSGIGYAIAKACLGAGADVVITSRDESRAESAVAKIKQETLHENIYGISLDLIDVHSFEETISRVNTLLSSKVDMLVNNAGIASSNVTDSNVNFDMILQSNLKGTYFLSITFAEYLRKEGISGHILNIASSSSLRPAITPYGLSKWGIRGLTLGLAKKYIKNNIVINGIAPGPTATPMLNRTIDDISNTRNPIDRLILPEEVASMAVVLLSGIGNSVVGDIVYMSGGAGLITYDDVDY